MSPGERSINICNPYLLSNDLTTICPRSSLDTNYNNCRSTNYYPVVVFQNTFGSYVQSQLLPHHRHLAQHLSLRILLRLRRALHLLETLQPRCCNLFEDLSPVSYVFFLDLIYRRAYMRWRDLFRIHQYSCQEEGICLQMSQPLRL